MGLVSIIIPCFNYGRYLRECVQSLLRQSYTHWECIIVDDGSTDDTASICSDLADGEPRIRVLRQANRGPNAARNSGVRQAAGEYVQFLDADDLLQSEKLAAHVGFLRAHPSVDIVAGDAAYVDESGKGPLRAWTPERVEGRGSSAVRALIYENALMVHSPLVRRRVFDSVGLLDESLRGHEDWEFWLRCALRGCQFAYFSAEKDGLALVRRHGRNTSAGMRMMFETAVIVREALQEKLPPDLRGLNAERLSELRWRRGLELMQIGRLREGWKLYAKGLRSARRKAFALRQLILAIPGIRRAAQSLRKWVIGIQPRR